MSIVKEKCVKCSYERVLRKEGANRCPKCGHVKGTRINKKQVSVNQQ